MTQKRAGKEKQKKLRTEGTNTKQIIQCKPKSNHQNLHYM